ncbi:hypothetical protein FRC09_015250 [Ceratobasidium sp. 395]|nr:hypothetical protein FRC09_015250 [Ceratobasidium sp. 395]
MEASTYPPIGQSYLPPSSPPEQWEIPLFSSPEMRGPLSIIGSDSTEDASDVNEPETSRKRHRSDSDDEECDREQKINRNFKACKECKKAKAKCVRAHSNDTSPCTRCSTMRKKCMAPDALPRKDTNRRFILLRRQLEHMEEMHRLLEKALRRQSEMRRYHSASQQKVHF